MTQNKQTHSVGYAANVNAKTKASASFLLSLLQQMKPSIGGANEVV